jgi:hypothetical protein
MFLVFILRKNYQLNNYQKSEIMAIKISDSELNKEYIHQGVHRIKLGFKGKGSSNGEEIKFLLRSKNSELIKFIVEGKEKDEIRFNQKFSIDLQTFEQEIIIKQLYTPDIPVYSGFLISARNDKGDTASEEFVVQCN